MAKRDKFAYVALGLVAGLAISLLLLVWSVPGFRNPTYHQERQEHVQYKSGGLDDPVIVTGFWSRYATPQDTYAQWIMAALSIVATGFSMWAVLLVRGTLNETRRQVHAAEKAFFYDQRPWIDFEIFNYSFDALPSGRAVICGIKIRNIGKSPAFAVLIGSSTMTAGGDYKKCAVEAVENAVGNENEAPIILMGDDLTTGMMIFVENHSLERLGPSLQEGYKAVAVAIAVTYSSAATDTKHVTVKTFHLADFDFNVYSGKLTFQEVTNDLGENIRETRLQEQEGRRDYR